jgi:hypothetical protein
MKKTGEKNMPEKSIRSSSEIQVPCVYFGEAGPANTKRTIEIAARRADELDIKHIVVASASGETALDAATAFRSRSVVVVTHSTGFLRPDFQELDPERRKKIEAAGAKILTCQHALGGVNRAVRKKLGSYELDEILALTLKIFGQGLKVAVEISLMAADAGLIPTTEPCLSIGGTGTGADTAVLLRPSNAQTFFDLKIMEILAKPRLE